ncbi:hypothetical protein [Thermococcus sp. 5-4]|uniref:hypothetical protein n=1 Tax=Thermococcus sp. 5-4 TaxID=2008440 RepID=UPI000B4A0044|nr:hypothetical protein [Thermococcus sp. 5-4]ASA78336.1 hypothetical protein CDI07_08525 [Thermococcus sp. 5-4]
MLKINDKIINKWLSGETRVPSYITLNEEEFTIREDLDDSFEVILSNPGISIKRVGIAGVIIDNASSIKVSSTSVQEVSLVKILPASEDDIHLEIELEHVKLHRGLTLQDIEVNTILSVRRAKLGDTRLENVKLESIYINELEAESFILEGVAGPENIAKDTSRIEFQNLSGNIERIRFKNVRNFSRIVLSGGYKSNNKPTVKDLEIQNVSVEGISIMGVYIKKFEVNNSSKVGIGELNLSNVEIDELKITGGSMTALHIENSKIDKLLIDVDDIEMISFVNVIVAHTNKVNTKNVTVTLTARQNEMKLGMLGLGVDIKTSNFNNERTKKEGPLMCDLRVNSLQGNGDLIIQPKTDFDNVILENLQVRNIKIYCPKNTINHIEQFKLSGDIYSGNITEVFADLKIENIDFGRFVLSNVEVGNKLQIHSSARNVIRDKFSMKKVTVGDDLELLNYDICPGKDAPPEGNMRGDVFEMLKVYIGGDVILEVDGNFGLSSRTPAWIRKIIYGVARRNYDANGNPEKADKYFVLEMRSRREDNRWKSRNSKSIRKKITGELGYWGEIILIDIFSEYGTNWKRTFGVWLGIWLMGAILYGIYDLFGLLSSESVHSIVGYMYISLSALVTSDPSVRFSTGFAIWTYAIEMGIGIYIWTQLLALFSRQFMRGA